MSVIMSVGVETHGHMVEDQSTVSILMSKRLKTSRPIQYRQLLGRYESPYS